MTSTHIGLTKRQHLLIKRAKENANSKFIATVACMLDDLGINTVADAVAYGTKNEEKIKSFEITRGGK